MNANVICKLMLAVAIFFGYSQTASAQHCQDFDSMSTGLISSPYNWNFGSAPFYDALLQITNGNTTSAEITVDGADEVWGSYSTDKATILAYNYDGGSYAAELEFDVYLTPDMTIQAWDTLDNLIYSRSVTDGGGYWDPIYLSDGDGIERVEIDGDTSEVYLNNFCFQRIRHCRRVPGN